MVIAKANTYGLEFFIKVVQNDLDTELSWLGERRVYGKLQPTIREGKVIPEAYIGGNKEYSEIFTNDKVASTIGFYVKSREVNNYITTAVIDVIFTVNLKEIFGNDLRDDERAIDDAVKILTESQYVSSLKQVKEYIPEVFADFDKTRIAHRDMEPFYVFSIGIDLTYREERGCT